jgi:hypothetical protein
MSGSRRRFSRPVLEQRRRERGAAGPGPEPTAIPAEPRPARRPAPRKVLAAQAARPRRLPPLN